MLPAVTQQAQTQKAQGTRVTLERPTPSATSSTSWEVPLEQAQALRARLATSSRKFKELLVSSLPVLLQAVEDESSYRSCATNR